MTTSTQWHLDKKVPVSLIAAIILQTFAFGWMARGLDAKATANTAAITAINRELDLRRPIIQNNSTSVAVLSSQLSDIKESQKIIIEMLKRDKDEQ